MSLRGRPLPTADVGYPVDQLGSQLSGGELARPTGAGRPIAARQASRKRPVAWTGLFQVLYPRSSRS